MDFEWIKGVICWAKQTWEGWLSLRWFWTKNSSTQTESWESCLPAKEEHRGVPKGQLNDEKIKEYKKLIELGKVPEFREDEQRTIWFKNRICVPEIKHLFETILKEAHDSTFSIHLGSTKMYQDFKQKY
jgi:hypothetical protein